MLSHTTVRTARLTLVPPTEEDRDGIGALLTDPAVTATYMVPEGTSRATVDRLTDRLITLGATEGRLVYALRLGAETVGLLHDVGIDGESIELGYALLSVYHGRGLMTEAVGAVSARLLAQGYTVRAGVFEKNEASARLLRRVGFLPTGEKELISYRGAEHTCLYYELRPDT